MGKSRKYRVLNLAKIRKIQNDEYYDVKNIEGLDVVKKYG